MQILTELHARHLGNRLKDRAGRPIVAGIVLHDTTGTGTRFDTEYLANPDDGRQVSADFVIEREGFVYQLNPDPAHRSTFHAGRATLWTWNGRTFKNDAVSRATIGVKLCQKANMSLSPVWPDVQLKNAAELCVQLCNLFKLRKEQITTHSQINTDGTRSDPRNFPFDSFWFFFNRLANMPTVEKINPELGEPIIYEVRSGETLAKISKRFGRPIEQIKALNGINTPSDLVNAGQKLIIQK